MKLCKKFNKGNTMKNKIRMGFAAAFTVLTLVIMPVQAGGTTKGSTTTTQTFGVQKINRSSISTSSTIGISVATEDQNLNYSMGAIAIVVGTSTATGNDVVTNQLQTACANGVHVGDVVQITVEAPDGNTAIHAGARGRVISLDRARNHMLVELDSFQKGHGGNQYAAFPTVATFGTGRWWVKCSEARTAIDGAQVSLIGSEVAEFYNSSGCGGTIGTGWGGTLNAIGQQFTSLSSLNNLAQYKILFINNYDNCGSGPMGSATGALANFVSAGGVLVIHDRWGNPQSWVPGASAMQGSGHKTGINIDRGPDAAQFTDGNFGVITNTDLDNGNSSTHGYICSGYPVDTKIALTNGSCAVALAYRYGKGWVYYSTIPLDFYQAGYGSIALAMQKYAKNLALATNVLTFTDCNNNGIADAIDITGSSVTRVAGFTGVSGSPYSYTESGITFTSAQEHVHLEGGSYIYNHSSCCTTPIVITATEPVFTLKSLDVLYLTSSWGTVLVGSNGASVILSSTGTYNFGTTFQNVAWVRWEENHSQSDIDNVAIEVGVPGVPDCNGNGIPDSCELADGSAVDQNGNGVPDSCDPFPVLRLTTNAAACNTVGSTVTVDATLSGVLNNVVAGQMLLTWDVSKLSFAAVLPGDAPYTTAYALNEQAGTIMILASTTAGGTGTTAASAVVSRIQFTVIGGSCSGTGNEVDFFTFGPMGTEFTDGYGGATVPTLLASAGFVVDDGAPVLSNVPANVTVQAEAGMGSFANVALTAPTATDACAPGLTTSSSRSDGASLGAAFPVGTTTVTWSATDPCANTTTATTLVTVNNANTATFAVSYSGGYPASSSRNFALDIHGDNGNNARSTSAIFAAGTASFSITDLAIANYDCVSIRDIGHSLRRRVAMSDVGTDWSATATLIAGDLNGNDVIDVVDWGMYIVGNSNADLDGNGVINSTDGAIIISNFGKQSDAVCGGALMGPPDPISAISVAELVERGLTDLIGADLNNDGWLDMEDVRMASN